MLDRLYNCTYAQPGCPKEVVDHSYHFSCQSVLINSAGYISKHPLMVTLSFGYILLLCYIGFRYAIIVHTHSLLALQQHGVHVQELSYG